MGQPTPGDFPRDVRLQRDVILSVQFLRSYLSDRMTYFRIGTKFDHDSNTFVLNNNLYTRFQNNTYRQVATATRAEKL